MDKQVEEKSIEYMNGFRTLYNLAKMINLAIILISFIIAVLSVVASVLGWNYNNIIGFITFIWGTLSIYLNKCAVDNRKKAADLQEMYDLHILGLGENKKIMYPKEKNYRVINHRKFKEEKYYDIDESNIEIKDIIFLQKDNISYDNKMRSTYYKITRVYLISYIIMMVTCSIIMKLDFYKLVIYIIIPSINIFNYLIKNIVNLKDELNQLRDAEVDIMLFIDFINNKTYEEKINEIRSYQDFIYLKRRNWTMVPNYIYKIHLRTKKLLYDVKENSNKIKDENLQEEAFNIEQNLGIIKFLEKYGRAEIVGSVANDFILRKDIDIHLLTSLDINLVCKNVVKFLKVFKSIYDIQIEDYKVEKESVCVIIKKYNGWDIEIWISNNEKYVGFNLKNDLKKLLDANKRRIIMNLKQYYYDRNLLNGEMSTDIYKAVIYDNIENLDEFKKYILKNI